MIITYTAAAATATYMYHLGEQHVMSQHPQQAFMLAWCTTIEPLRSLTIYKQTNNFMRGFLQHQQQLEADCHWLFTDLEKSTLTSFKVIATDENTIFLNVFDQFGWQQRYVWSFNLLVDLNKVLRQKHDDSAVQHRIDMSATPTKDPERIRGHPRLSTWLKMVQTTEVVEQRLIEINRYRMINMAQNQPAQEQQDEDMERPAIRQRVN